MCIICTKDYNINMTELNCFGCKYVKYIPKELINLKSLFISFTNIKFIPYQFINLTYIDCYQSAIISLPHTLINLKKIDCSRTNIKFIPKEFINLEIIICHNTYITFLPKQFTKLIQLDCHRTFISEIPKEFIYLASINILFTNIKYIPKELILLNFVLKPTDCYWDKSWNFNTRNIRKIMKLQKHFKNNYYLTYKMPTLWKIAEYYTSKKYAPENILNYINLD